MMPATDFILAVLSIALLVYRMTKRKGMSSNRALQASQRHPARARPHHTRLGLDPTTVLALQSIGSAMGHMVCIHNIVAACSILGIRNSEEAILVKTFPHAPLPRIRRNHLDLPLNFSGEFFKLIL